MRDLEKIPDHWLSEAALWKATPFVWKRWSRRHDDWTHDHCRFCWACICDHRDRDPFDKPGTVEGGHYRYAFYAERADGTYVWICRSCFKRVREVFGWTLDREAFDALSDEVKREVRKGGLSEKKVLADFEAWRKDRRALR